MSHRKNIKKNVYASRITTSPYFTKHEMAQIACHPDFLVIRKSLVTAVEECEDLSDQIMEVAADLSTKNAAKAEAHKIRAHEIASLSQGLQIILDMLDVSELALKDQLYIWQVPHANDGTVPWEKDIDKPVMRKFSATHMLAQYEGREAQVEGSGGNKNWLPDGPLLYSEAMYKTLPERASIEHMAFHNFVEINRIDKTYLNGVLHSIRDIASKEDTVLKKCEINLDEIIAFFDQDKMRSMRKSETGVSPH